MGVIGIHALHFCQDQYGGGNRILDDANGLYVGPCIPAHER